MPLQVLASTGASLLAAALILAACTSRPGSAADSQRADGASQDTAQASDAADASDEAAVPDATPDQRYQIPTPVSAVDRKRYLADLEQIAQPRVPGSEHWQAVQNLCAARFESLGYVVTRHAYPTGVNVVGTKQGTRRPSAQVLVSAHYDHIRDCPGADDNASGVAGVLESARVLALQGHERTLVVACWDEEERALAGSTAYAMAASLRGDQIVTGYVYEMIGYADDTPDSQRLPDGFDWFFPEAVADLEANDNRGDFITVLHDDINPGSSTAAAGTFSRAAAAIGLPATILAVDRTTLPVLAVLLRSDHASFWLQGFPALMVTDTAEFRNPHYHCRSGLDAVTDLDHDFAVKVIKATVGSALEMLRDD